MKTWFYSWIAYPILFSLAFLVSMFHRKTRKTLELRSWKDFLSLRFNAGQPIEYWVHVASAGELEYAIPILNELKTRGRKVLITYYSISAQTPVNALPATMPNVSLVVPLPHDGLGLMKEFVGLAKAQGIKTLFLMKYELWPGLLWECNRQGIKVFLVDALKPSWFHKKLLHKLDGIIAGYSSELDGVAHRNTHVVGDTRVERVLERLSKGQNLLEQNAFAALEDGAPVAFGSMWPPDDARMLAGLGQIDAAKRPNIIWVPHEIEPGRESSVKAGLAALGYETIDWDAFRARAAKADLPRGKFALLVMKKGFLAEIYRLSKKAYVGGGFGAGIHSVWEPAITGCLVACGPKNNRAPESKRLASAGVLTQIETGAELANWIQATTPVRKEVQQALEPVIQEHRSAAKRIVDLCA